MSAVSKRVIPCSIASLMTASDCSYSQRAPKLFVPRPTTLTSGPPCPSSRVFMTSTLPGDPTRLRRLEAAATEEAQQGQHDHDDDDDPEDAHAGLHPAVAEAANIVSG